MRWSGPGNVKVLLGCEWRANEKSRWSLSHWHSIRRADGDVSAPRWHRTAEVEWDAEQRPRERQGPPWL